MRRADVFKYNYTILDSFTQLHNQDSHTGHQWLSDSPHDFLPGINLVKGFSTNVRYALSAEESHSTPVFDCQNVKQFSSWSNTKELLQSFSAQGVPLQDRRLCHFYDNVRFPPVWSLACSLSSFVSIAQFFSMSIWHSLTLALKCILRKPMTSA